MLVYIDENGNKDLTEYDSPQEKDRIIARYHKRARVIMSSEDCALFKYTIIDYKKMVSTVYETKRTIAESFQTTAY